jgi:hypothetical protein
MLLARADSYPQASEKIAYLAELRPCCYFSSDRSAYHENRALSDLSRSQRPTMITAVLPLTTKDAGRAQILFKSIAKFFDPDLLAHVLIIVPDHQAVEISASFAECGVRHRVVNESEICGDVAGVSGWYVQQIAKLGAWRFVDTPFCLTLDSDVICTRRTSYADLVQNNLARQHREPRAVHAQWWKRSARLLGVRASLSGDGMGVTPLLYAAEVTRRLTVELDRLHGSWLEALKSNHLWAEHALYDLYLSKQKEWGKFHFAGQLYGPSVWHRADFDRWDTETTFSPAAPWHFAVCQSNTEIPVEEVWEKVEPFLA